MLLHQLFLLPPTVGFPVICRILSYLQSHTLQTVSNLGCGQSWSCGSSLCPFHSPDPISTLAFMYYSCLSLSGHGWSAHFRYGTSVALHVIIVSMVDTWRSNKTTSVGLRLHPRHFGLCLSWGRFVFWENPELSLVVSLLHRTSTLGQSDHVKSSRCERKGKATLDMNEEEGAVLKNRMGCWDKGVERVERWPQELMTFTCYMTCHLISFLFSRSTLHSFSPFAFSSIPGLSHASLLPIHCPRCSTK